MGYLPFRLYMVPARAGYEAGNGNFRRLFRSTYS